MKYSSTIALNEIRSFAQSFGVEILELDNWKCGSYNFSNKKIYIQKHLPVNKHLITLVHELGHALQSPLEFKSSEEPTIEDKLRFILAVEEDAWAKGRDILQRLCPYLPASFWFEFNDYLCYSIGTYYTMDKKIDIHVLFNTYNDFLNVYHKDVKPICFEELLAEKV